MSFKQLEQQSAQLFAPVVEPIHALLQVQVEGASQQGIELLEQALSITTVVLDTVDVARLAGEAVSHVDATEVLRVADTDQPIVAAPSIAVHYRVERHPATNDDQKPVFTAVRYLLRVDAAVPLEDAEDYRPARGAAAHFAAHAVRAS